MCTQYWPTSKKKWNRDQYKYKIKLPKNTVRHARIPLSIDTLSGNNQIDQKEITKKKKENARQ